MKLFINGYGNASTVTIVHVPYKKLYTHLRHTGRRQKRKNKKDNRGIIIGRVPISERPKVVELRNRIGDIEVDLMMGSNHKLALLVMTDRTTLVTMLEKLQSKNAEEVYEKMKSRLTNFNSCWIKTITFDNDKEFSKHNEIVKDLSVKTYFTRPYTSQDKGIVENRIRVIRRFFPKKTDLRNYGLVEKNIKNSYVATNERDLPCFRIWLMESSENEKIKDFFTGNSPTLNENEALLEGAFTIPSYRGNRIMPAAMAEISEKGKDIGVRYILIFPYLKNIPSLKSCRRSGFHPYILRREKWFLCKKRIVFEDIPKDILEKYYSDTSS